MSGLLIRMIQWFQKKVSVKRTLCESNELKLPKENRHLNYTCQKQTSRFNETSFKICSGGIKNMDNTTEVSMITLVVMKSQCAKILQTV